jgi:hypothetical protein
MTNYWWVWPIGIALWLLVGWGEFSWYESRALKKSAGKDQVTLSMFCYTIISKFPLALFLGGLMVGLFWGILMTHLAWHWCPAGSVSAG